jgi:hypothetical protein
VIRIVLVNESNSGVADAELEKIAWACELQLHTDLPALYGREASITRRLQGLRVLCAHRVEARADDWRVELDPLEAYKESGAFHAVRDGVPFAKIKPDASKPALGRASRLFSHECVELVCSPRCDVIIETTKLGPVMFEPCDPCQYLCYAIDGATVSSLVGARWYMPHLSAQALGAEDLYDCTGAITEPFQMWPGGYVDRVVDGRWVRDRCERPTPSTIFHAPE